MENLNLSLLLFGSPSIIMLFSFVVVFTLENVKRQLVSVGRNHNQVEEFARDASNQSR